MICIRVSYAGAHIICNRCDLENGFYTSALPRIRIRIPTVARTFPDTFSIHRLSYFTSMQSF